MFEQLFKRQFDINRHVSAPLLEEVGRVFISLVIHQFPIIIIIGN